MGRTRLLVANADGGDAHPLTGQDGNEGFPSLSPDGKHVAFESDVSGQRRVYSVQIDGSELRQLTVGDHGGSTPKFGSDGSLSYLLKRERIGKLQKSDLVVTRDGKSKTVVRNQYVFDYVWSPDAKTLAISKLGELVFYDLARDEETVLALPKIDERLNSHVAMHMSWSPESDKLACRIEFLGGRLQGTKIFGDDDLYVLSPTEEPRSFPSETV